MRRPKLWRLEGGIYGGEKEGVWTLGQASDPVDSPAAALPPLSSHRCPPTIPFSALLTPFRGRTQWLITRSALLPSYVPNVGEAFKECFANKYEINMLLGKFIHKCFSTKNI